MYVEINCNFVVKVQASIATMDVLTRLGCPPVKSILMAICWTNTLISWIQLLRFKFLKNTNFDKSGPL